MRKQKLKLIALAGLIGFIGCSNFHSDNTELKKSRGAYIEEKRVVDKLMEELRYEKKLLDYRIQNSFYNPNEILIGMLK